MIKTLALLLACFWLPSAAQAATLGGATLPDTYTVDGQPLTLNGVGLRTLTIFKVKAYIAGLYLQRPSHDARQILASPGPKVVLLKFLHAGSKEQIEKQFREGEAKNCGDGSCAQSNQADFERLVAAAPAVEVGDTSTYVFIAKRVRVLANNKVIGDFANPDLANHLLAGFIGARPPSDDLRDHMLGLQEN